MLRKQFSFSPRAKYFFIIFPEKSRAKLCENFAVIILVFAKK
jgi:hypothetical protein